MASCLFRPLSAALAVALVSVAPALAQQVSAKTAWEDLRRAARENGIIIGSEGVTDYGTSLVATGVRVVSDEDRDAGALTMDELRIEPRGEHVALMPSAQITLVVRPGSQVERVFRIDHDGEVLYRVTEDEMDFAMDFGQLDIRMTHATRGGRALEEVFGAEFAGLDSALNITRDGAVDFTFDAGRVAYDYAFEQRAGIGGMHTAGTAQIDGLSLVFEALEMDMLSEETGALARAFDAGFMARLVMTAGQTTADSVQRFDGQEIAIRQVAAGSEMLVELVDGAFAMNTVAGAGTMAGGMGPMQGEISIGGAAFDLGFPLVASASERPISFGLALDGLTPTPETLAMIGAQDFAGDSMSLALRLGADGRLLEQLGDGFGTGDEPPFDLSNVRLEELSLSVGDARLTGTGAFVFLGGLLASIDADLPIGTGDFVFDLVGGDALLGRLGAAGLIPQDQQFFARMMMNGLGRPIGEDHLRSEVAIRPGGSVTVNGAPLPF